MIKINKAGYLYIVLTVIIGFSAVNTGNNLIYIVASALLSYMLVSGIFGRRNIQAIDVELELPQEVFAETDTPIVVRLINHKRFMPAFLIRITVGPDEVLFPFVPQSSSSAQSYTKAFEKRGLHAVENIYVASVFPFNLFTRYRKIPKRFEVTVFPKPRKCFLADLTLKESRKKGETSSNIPGYDSDIVSIRDYTLGDPLKYISWKSTAKTGVLKTKELSSIESECVIIDFDAMNKQRLEYALSCVTYTVIRLLKYGVPVGLHVGGELLRPGTSTRHKLTLLTKLALYVQD